MNSHYTKILGRLPQPTCFSNNLPNARQFLWPLLLADEETSQRMKSVGNNFFKVLVSEKNLLQAAEESLDNKLGAILLYEKPLKQSEDAAYLLDDKSRLVLAIRLLKQRYPELTIAVDLCVCQYTVSGHCRLDINQIVSTEEFLIKLALFYREYGVDILMPSGMIPNFSQNLRSAFIKNDTTCPLIYSQSAKFLSSLYSPFRGSLNICREIDKSSYQIEPNNIKKAAKLILNESPDGADISLIKPAIPYYLEVFDEVKALSVNKTPPQCGAFITSGEHHYLLNLGRELNSEYTLLASAIDSMNNEGASTFVSYVAPELVKFFNRL